MSEPIVVGIDLGTTYSAVAYVDEQGRPKVIPNAEGKTTTPSVVLVENGRTAVGDVALGQWITNEEHVVRWIKRAMGDPDYRFQGLSAVEISAKILETLRRDAEAHLGRPVTEAVVTCPAYFAALEIENTKKAGEMAGLKVREVVKEPTAAAVCYGVDNMRDGQTVLVCDLGGGTFDATVLSYDKGVFSPRSSMGSRKLGGHDWTMDLVALVAERFEEKHGEDPRNDLVLGQRLYEDCEKAKRDFARVTSVSIPCRTAKASETITVSRDEFEARTESRIFELVSWCEQALARSSPPLTWRDLDAILLVGGSSRLRRMAEALQQASGKQPVQVREPDLAVAYGAAILARGKVRPRGGLVEPPGGGGLIEVVSERILVRDLGTRAVKREAGKARIVSASIIPRGTKLPTSAARDDFEVSSDRQENFEAPVIEFDDPEDPSFELVGNFRFKCLPKAKRGDRIKVVFSYDISGIPTVEAFDVRSGKKLDAERNFQYKDPSPEELAAIKARWVVFAIDVSGSMMGDKLSRARQGLIENARQLLATGGPDAKVGIVAFGSHAQVACRPTNDIQAVEKAANGLNCDGSTAMDEGILAAIDLAARAPEGIDRDVVLLTDGMPDDATKALEAAALAKRKGCTLSALAIGQTEVDDNFINQLTPIKLTIDSAEGIGQGFSTLLSLAAQSRSGLTDV